MFNHERENIPVSSSNGKLGSNKFNVQREWLFKVPLSAAMNLYFDRLDTTILSPPM